MNYTMVASSYVVSTANSTKNRLEEIGTISVFILSIPVRDTCGDSIVGFSYLLGTHPDTVEGPVCAPNTRLSNMMRLLRRKPLAAPGRLKQST